MINKLTMLIYGPAFCSLTLRQKQKTLKLIWKLTSYKYN